MFLPNRQEPEFKFTLVKDGVQRLKDKNLTGIIEECHIAEFHYVRARVKDFESGTDQCYYSDSVDDVLMMIDEQTKKDRQEARQ